MILADDGSSDATVEPALGDADDRVHMIEPTVNQGTGSAAGLAYSSPGVRRGTERVEMLLRMGREQNDW